MNYKGAWRLCYVHGVGENNSFSYWLIMSVHTPHHTTGSSRIEFQSKLYTGNY